MTHETYNQKVQEEAQNLIDMVGWEDLLSYEEILDDLQPSKSFVFDVYNTYLNLAHKLQHENEQGLSGEDIIHQQQEQDLDHSRDMGEE